MAGVAAKGGPTSVLGLGGKHFFTQGHVGLDFCFPFIIKNSFKNCMLCLLVLSLINI